MSWLLESNLFLRFVFVCMLRSNESERLSTFPFWDYMNVIDGFAFKTIIFFKISRIFSCPNFQLDQLQAYHVSIFKRVIILSKIIGWLMNYV